MPASPAPLAPSPSSSQPGGAKSKGDLNAQTKRIQELVAQIDSLGNPQARALVQELLPAILQLHGLGLERILALLTEAGAPARPVYERLLLDNVVSGLLLIHDLHPRSLTERMNQALEKVLPYIRSHGGNVELVSLRDGVAKLRLQGTCKSCSSSSITLEPAVRAAIEEFCPDLLGFDVEGIEEVKVPPPSATCAEPAALAAASV